MTPPEGNLSVVLVEDALGRGLGSRPAVLGDGVTWTYEELARRAAAAAGWLVDLGLRRGDRLLLALRDSPEWIALFLGAMRVGAVCALASPDLPRERLADAARRLGPATIIAEEGALGPRAIPAAGARRAVTDCTRDPGAARIRRDDPAYLLLTSGSTGPSKWAVHRAGDIASCIATYGRRVLRLGPGDVTWSVASLSTSYGLGNSCYFPLGAGAAAVVDGSDRSPGRCAAACAAHRVSALFGVPTSWARLARHAAEGRIDAGAFGTVRLAVSAGEPLPPATWRAVEQATGLRLVNALGSSEASNLYLSDCPGRPRPGTVGWPVAGYQLAVRPTGDGSGGAGELLVRGPTIMSGYLGRDPVQGWFSTGDLVRRERDGSYSFLGRVGDRFKSGGLWIDPQEVRSALEELLGVAEAAVLPVEDDAGLVRVGAIVMADPGARAGLAERVASAARDRLRPHEVPRAIVVCDSLPTTASGKLDRTRAASMLRDALPRTVRMAS